MFTKRSYSEKISLEGKVKMVKNERKIYIIALITALVILPCDIVIDLQTDLNIVAWLYNYSKVGSIQRELDDPQYIYLNCVNAMLELKNIKLKVVNESTSIQQTTQEVKLPALKSSLIKCKASIPETILKMENIVIDEYAIRWNNIPIDGAYRHWFKEISNNINRIDVILLDYVKDCVIESYGANVYINWKESFRLVNNEILMPRNVTSRVDVSVRTFRVKNFFQILPTYAILWDREVWGIKSSKCPRCIVEEETWDHIWICNKNHVDNSEFNLFKESIDEVLSILQTSDDTVKGVKDFGEKILEIASERSALMSPENLLRELTRGIVNEKWMTIHRNKQGANESFT